MGTKVVRRAVLALVAFLVTVGLSMVSPAPASANTLYGRIPAGGCITGIAVEVNGIPLCLVVD